MRDLYNKITRWLYETFEFLIKAAVEAIDAVYNAFAAVFKAIPESRQKVAIPRRNWSCRNWTRPRNQKIRPLMFNRKNRVFHCRNAI